MFKLMRLINSKISNKILFALLLLITLLTTAILFSTVIRLTNDNVKVTRDSLNMISTSVFQNLRTIMNIGDIDLMKKAEANSRSIEGIVKLEILRNQPLIDLFSKDQKLTADNLVLKSFETKMIQISETNNKNGHNLRMVKPMIASNECIVCHTNQQVGDVIGSIDLTFSLDKADENLDNIINNIIFTAMILGLLTLIIIYYIVQHATIPLTGLKQGLQRLLVSSESFKDLKLSIRSSDEIAEVAKLFNQYMDKLYQDYHHDITRITNSIVNSQPNMIISTNLKIRSIETVNKEFCDFFNVSSADEFKKIYGECICNTFDKDKNYIQSINDGEYWYDYIAKRADKIHKVKITINDKEHIFKVTTSKFKLADSFYNSAIFSDITELDTLKTQLEDINSNLQNKVEEELNKHKKDIIKHEEYLENIIDIIPSMILISDGNSIKQVNKKMLEFTNYSSQEKFVTDHKCICELFMEGDNLLQPKMGEQNWLEYVLENKNKVIEVEMLDKDKKHQFVVLGSQLEKCDGELDESSSVVIFLDVTDIKEAYEKIHLQEEIMIAQSKQVAMGEMISMIAHQWRQPLSVISMDANNILADIELETLETNSLKEDLYNILFQTQELSKTIDDLKNFFKPKQDMVTLKVNKIFEDTFNVIGKSLENNNIEVIKELNSKQNIDTYARELMQVFINIINNAKEALVSNKFVNKNISISTEDTKEEIIIKICDNAGGIKDNIKEKIFEPYFSTKEKKTGTGLGLYISKTIIEEHLHGTIEVSNENGGACFIIKIPLSLINHDELISTKTS